MKLFWWRRKRQLDAAARRRLRSNLAELDYDLKRISWDVTRAVGSAESAHQFYEAVERTGSGRVAGG